jgi:S1-C subfamily serine protease
MKAKLVGHDPSTDMALLRVDRTDLPYITFGNSDSILVGEWVLAVGNPFDLTSTVTAGIVSAKGRNIDILRNTDGLPAIESFIQTDAAVNPGNSGGALVNTRGELVGINTAIATPTGTYAGYAFAVPVSIVRKVIGDLMEFGVVQRAFLGVQINILRDDLEGLFIDEVQEGTGAEEAGLRGGDIIKTINGAAVTTFPQLQEQVSRYRPGDRIEVQYMRDGRTRSTMVTLKNADRSTELVSRELVEATNTLGLSLEPISREESRKFKIVGGVRVGSVLEGPVANQTRIGNGFIITMVNDREVSQPEDITKAMGDNPESVILEGFYPDYPYKIYNYQVQLP